MRRRNRPNNTIKQGKGEKTQKQGGGTHDLSKYNVPTSFMGIAVPTKVAGMLLVSALPTKLVGMQASNQM